ncbi:DUF5316 family protein [Pseudalkalibacillus sp. Hm43]|uniref:DUF5316 family protein n=1 Tax=Pseudalkalibacillus sp. Hm43 TaxID=3450742 RepID=UPI003F435ABA
MKKAFIAGLIFLLILIVVTFTSGDWTLLYKIGGTVGLGSMLLSGLLLGAFVNGMQLRANYLTETKKDRKNRNRYAYMLFAFGLPNLAAGIISIVLL